MNNLMKIGLATTMFVALTSASTYAAEGSINIGNSSPAVLYVYTANTMSTAGYWDLRTNSGIPVNATVTNVRESWTWCTSGCGQSGTRVALYNGSGSGYYMDAYNGVTAPLFAGEPARQNWSTRFSVTSTPFSNGAYIIPKLVIWWKDTTTLTSGVTTLEQGGAKETKVLPTGFLTETVKL